MTTRKLYLYPNAPLAGEARITAITQAGDQLRIMLNQTVFHVKGGGQLPDQGSICGLRVLDVRHCPDGNVEHLLDYNEAFKVGQVVLLEIDSSSRARNSRLHTAGHLIAGVMSHLAPTLPPLGGHHYPGECRVEFGGGEEIIERIRMELPEQIRKSIAENAGVAVCGDPEANRTIAIGNYPSIPCGGTHVKEVGSLGKITIGKVRMKDGRLRISYEL